MSNSADSVRRAIEVMTAWTEDADFPRERLRKLAEDEGLPGLFDATYGLVSLCGILLTYRERETDVDAAVQLQRIAAALPTWLGE